MGEIKIYKKSQSKHLFFIEIARNICKKTNNKEFNVQSLAFGLCTIQWKVHYMIYNHDEIIKTNSVQGRLKRRTLWFIQNTSKWRYKKML